MCCHTVYQIINKEFVMGNREVFSENQQSHLNIAKGRLESTAEHFKDNKCVPLPFGINNFDPVLVLVPEYMLSQVSL